MRIKILNADRFSKPSPVRRFKKIRHIDRFEKKILEPKCLDCVWLGGCTKKDEEENDWCSTLRKIVGEE